MSLADEWAWQEDAECQDEPLELFFGFEGEPAVYVAARKELAKEFCDRCLVRSECLEYAMLHRMFGVWGGMDEDDRRAEARRRRERAKYQARRAAA